MARCNSLFTSLEAFLNSRIPWPRPLANSGIFFAPNKTRMTTSTSTSSPPLNPNTASIALVISKHHFLEKLYALCIQSKEAKR